MSRRIVTSDREVYIYANDILIGYGGIGKNSPLSNFYECKFTYRDIIFENSECAIMWEKAMLFEDTDIAKRILQAKRQPRKAKMLGRKVKNFDGKNWKERRDVAVPEILFAKFSQNEDLKKWLLDTEDATLAEIGYGRYKDLIWGIGITIHHEDIDKPENWNTYGQNFLGKTLMSVRERLKAPS